MKKILILLLLACWVVNGYAQWIPEFLTTSPDIKEENNNKLTLDIDAVGFFKNNEYFSPLSKGQTFPGIRFIPKAGYQIDNKLRFELGVLGLYLSGNQDDDVLSTFNEFYARIQYAIRPNLHLVFGNLYGGANHRLIEPLYRWDNQLVEKQESGLQVIYKDDRFFADVWVDWRRYIEHGDSVPEILNFGLSASARLSPEENDFQLTLPFQLLIYHQGGQIDTSDEKMIVTGNVATGLKMKWKLHGRTIRSLGFDTYLLGYYDKLSNKELRPYDNGWAVYPVFKAETKYIDLMAGYYHGCQFYSVDGDPLFSSFNLRYPDEVHKTRQLFTAKVSYFKQLHKSFSIGAQAESYFDIKLNKFDYSFGINLRLNTKVISR
ncbi:hypothetical protein [Bacteroides sp. 519]|uniref:hypothetical protein n=1 Tax=Bacteroides sp. 519 TaxID=2302937 RepID=UPI0013D719D0|nr:hypothetical protein [Bacteroides sp. 519]NDV60244.1 hypothetical protein [Bacteroides sp. 519]